MSADENVARVRTLYAHAAEHAETEGTFLGRDALWDLLAEDVEWWAAGPPALLPWAGTYRGHDGVRLFLKALNDAMSYERFDPREYVAQGITVVEIVDAAGTSVASGRPFVSEIVRVWTLQDGKAVKVRSYYDTAAYVAALHGPVA